MTTIVIVEYFWPDGSITNSTVHTAANGDMLESTWYSAPGASSESVAFPYLYATFAGEETYVGGSGKFLGASGSSRLEGTATVSLITGSLSGQYTTSGTITY